MLCGAILLRPKPCGAQEAGGDRWQARHKPAGAVLAASKQFQGVGRRKLSFVDPWPQAAHETLAVAGNAVRLERRSRIFRPRHARADRPISCFLSPKRPFLLTRKHYHNLVICKKMPRASTGPPRLSTKPARKRPEAASAQAGSFGSTTAVSRTQPSFSTTRRSMATPDALASRSGGPHRTRAERQLLGLVIEFEDDVLAEVGEAELEVLVRVETRRIDRKLRHEALQLTGSPMSTSRRSAACAGGRRSPRR